MGRVEGKTARKLKTVKARGLKTDLKSNAYLTTDWIFLKFSMKLRKFPVAFVLRGL